MPGMIDLAIDFQARFAGHPFSCRDAIPLPGGEALTFSQLKLFLHDLRLVDVNGEEVPLQLASDGRWQSDPVALLDFEDGSGHCRNGSSATHTRVVGMLPQGDYRGLKFRVGVPFDLNHADPIRATPPLTESSMHWGWQGGYKFLRLDGRVGGRPFIAHLGSTGCEGTIGHISSCARPNRPEITLPDFTLERPGVFLELDRLLEGALEPAEPSRSTGPSDPVPQSTTLRCMGGADEPGCGSIFSSLGLELATGRPVGTAKVFTSP